MVEITAPAGLTQGDFRAAVAAGGDWRDIAGACLDQLGDVRGANLGFVYIGDMLTDQAASVLTLLKQVTGVENWVGSLGLGICARGVELFDRPALAVMVARLPEDAFRLVPMIDGLAANRGLDPDVAAWIGRAQPMLGLVHGDPRNPRIGTAITALAHETGAFLVGGLTSSRRDFSQICGSMTAGGVSGVLFGQDVPVLTGLSQGCSPIGPQRMITAAHNNVIERIDDRPALDVFKEDIGELLARDLRRTAGYIFAALPVPSSDTGDYLVRNLVGIDLNDGLIAIAQQVAAGQPILFTRRDRDSAVQDLNRMLDGLVRRLGDRRPKGAVYVSCLARGPNLFGDDSEELRQVQTAIGDVPLVGFFANGEISHDRLYGYTGVLTLFL